MAIKFNEIKFYYLKANQFTTWFFASISDDKGFIVDVEFTNGALSSEVAILLSEMFHVIKKSNNITEKSIFPVLDIKHPVIGRSPTATALSAIRSGILQLESLHKGIPLGEHLGGSFKDRVPLYANINRGLFLTDRTPKSFATAATQAVAKGFKIIKCAPFDEVSSDYSTEDILSSAQYGLQRVKEIRDSIGSNIDILIDCHGRFDLPAALVIAEKLEKLSVSWFEEPLETEDHFGSLVEVKNNTSIPIAGGESMYGLSAFTELLEKGVLDIVMPDLKYCGGASEAVKIGKVAMQLNKGYSIHSPSGPVSLLLSAHTTSAVLGAMPLEHAVHEYPLRDAILTPSELIKNGNLIIPNTPGLGGRLNLDFIRKYGFEFSP
jgi:galactonate dehydratase